MSGWICPICGQELKAHGTKNSHMKKHKTDNVCVSFRCKQCDVMVDIFGRTGKEAQVAAKNMDGLCKTCHEAQS